MYYEPAPLVHCSELPFFHMENSYGCYVLTNQICPWAGHFDAVERSNLSQSFSVTAGAFGSERRGEWYEEKVTRQLRS